MTDQVKKNVPEPSDNDKQKMYDSLPQEHRDKQTYTEWVTEAYNNQWNSWMPWVEDKYLQWFGKDNKASYATKGEPPCLLGLSSRTGQANDEQQTRSTNPK